MKTVTILTRVLAHYRIPFFKTLHDTLLAHDVQLRLVYGQEFPGTVPKTVPLDEPWATSIRNTYLKISSTELVWQPCLKAIRSSDLVVIEQANGLLVNYLLLSRVVARGSKIAYWGHGRNFKFANESKLREQLKSSLICCVDWWFAYTKKSADLIEKKGVPSDKLTVVNNSLDTGALARACRELNGADQRVRKELGIASDHVAVYCGGMYQDKRLEFLLATCQKVRRKIPDFEMIFLGEGPLQHLVSDACARFPWMHYVGSKYGAEKVPYLKGAKAILMPGPVGLVIIDSFVLAVPLITTDIPNHGPEIYYLQNDKNGVMTEDCEDSFANGVAAYLLSPEKRERLQQGCREAAAVYTLENMVGRFATGILSCLGVSSDTR